MTIQQLSNFLAVCEELNYSRAAARLYLSRQALRQSIAALEQELCGALFAIEHNHLRLTEKGQDLRRQAAPVVEAFEQLRQSAYARISCAAPLRLGISVALVPDYLPSLPLYIEQFRQRYPGIALTLLDMPNDQVVQQLLQGQLDAGLVMDMGCPVAALRRTALTDHAACVLVPRGHPCWPESRMDPARLDGQRLLIPGLRKDLLWPLWSACQAAGAVPLAEVGLSFYQAYYQVRETGCLCLNREEELPTSELTRVKNLPLAGGLRLHAAFLQPENGAAPCVDLLREHLQGRLRENL